jgi:formylglycine-generating enzyme required for sulfatase activity
MADGRCPGIGRRIRLCLAFFAAAAVGCKSGDAVNGDTALPDAALADVAAPDRAAEPVGGMDDATSAGDGPAGPAATAVPSCAGLPATCGRSGDESCCTSLLVPGGTFYRNGIDYDTATLSDFYLDKFEITVGRFRAFVNAGLGTQSSPPAAGAGAHPLIGGSGWDAAWNASLPADTTALKTLLAAGKYPRWTDAPADNENRPQNDINWYLAFAFCAWDGGRLPTDAEADYAAAGGDEQRKYPWGSADADYTMASYDCMGDGLSGCSVTDLVVVGSKPAGNARWGHADLSGNIWEWVLDCYGELQTPCNDCANLFDPTHRIDRGGGFSNADTYLAPAYNSSDLAPKQVGPDIGARCARGKP